MDRVRGGGEERQVNLAFMAVSAMNDAAVEALQKVTANDPPVALASIRRELKVDSSIPDEVFGMAEVRASHRATREAVSRSRVS